MAPGGCWALLAHSPRLWGAPTVMETPTAALGPLSRYRLAAGTSEKIQLSSLIAAFQVTRDLVVAEA